MRRLRPGCECCDGGLPSDPTTARIGSFEGTFCARCAATILGGVCPSCGGEPAARPRRPAYTLAAHPPSAERVFKPMGRRGNP